VRSAACTSSNFRSMDLTCARSAPLKRMTAVLALNNRQSEPSPLLQVTSCLPTNQSEHTETRNPLTTRRYNIIVQKPEGAGPLVL
jgi:hypothetical protein